MIRRASLRELFEVDARFIPFAALTELHGEGQFHTAALKKLNMNPNQPDPLRS